MAGVAVEILLNRLISLIEEERKLLGGVGNDINDIKDDLETMRAFLQDADSRSETDQGVKTWVKQVREVAYDTEDVLDEFLLRLVRPRMNGIFDFLFHKLHYIKHLKTRHQLAVEILNIKARLKTISERRQAFTFTNIGEERINGANTTPNEWYDPRIASLYIDEAEVVGIEVPKNTLIEWLTKGEMKLSIIAVVGMGGLGKTTLVKKVYDSQIVNKYFDCHIWITVSKSPVIGELLRTTIKEVLKVTKEQVPEGMDAMDNNKLIEVLKNQLQKKRYVIIFDDIWDIHVWEAMKFAFPNCDCGSRIIFTTREGKVAACSNFIHNLEPLKEKEAWSLFYKKAFGSNHDDNSGCPKELKELSRNVLKKCSGLPLAIVLIGGLLARKPKTVLAWKNIHDSFGAEMMYNYELESLRRILMLSYNNLPHYLKPCFMYLSMFPEDYFIRRMTLIRMWIAEGFIVKKQGVTLEVVAWDYINELINRSMIQIAELTKCYEVKSFRIHDLVRETILSKCKEECFSITNIGEHGMGYLNEKARRISIYHNSSSSTVENNDSMVSRCSKIRSLIVFQLDETTPHSFQTTFLNAFRLLRVLDLEGSDLAVFPAELVKLIHLKYLSLRGNTKIIVLPSSVGKLKNLETLNLKETGVSHLPVQILKLQRLRHLLVYRYSAFNFNTFTSHRLGVSVSTGRIGNLSCLQKLSYLDFQHQAACGVLLKELGKLTQLRRLGIVNLKSKDGKDLCLALEKMKHLDALEIIISTTITDVNEEEEEEEEEFLELESLVSPPQFLRRLYLKGRLRRLPVWIAYNSLGNLTALALISSRLSCEEDDPLKAFQHLPNLVFLNLREAYDGEKLCCSVASGYQNLKQLSLGKMKGLKRVRFRQGSMPMLRDLYIWFCPELEMVPLGIEHLRGLQELRLLAVNPGLVNRIRKRRPRSAQGEGGGEDCWKVQHISTIKHLYHNAKGSYEYESLE